jgi:hypothetical protein
VRASQPASVCLVSVASVGADLRSRFFSLLAANPRSAIYGTILVTAVIGAAGGKLPAGEVLAATLTTLFVFWLAHVYADILGQRLVVDGRGLGAILRGSATFELPLLLGPVLPISCLVLGVLGVPGSLAMNLALSCGVGQLCALGVVVARRLHQSWPVTLLTGFVNGILGLIIVLLKSFLH